MRTRGAPPPHRTRIMKSQNYQVLNALRVGIGWWSKLSFASIDASRRSSVDTIYLFIYLKLQDTWNNSSLKKLRQNNVYLVVTGYNYKITNVKPELQIS